MRVKKYRDAVKDIMHYGHRTWKICTESDMKDSSLRTNFHNLKEYVSCQRRKQSTVLHPAVMLMIHNNDHCSKVSPQLK